MCVCVCVLRVYVCLCVCACMLQLDRRGKQLIFRVNNGLCLDASDWPADHTPSRSLVLSGLLLGLRLTLNLTLINPNNADPDSDFS